MNAIADFAVNALWQSSIVAIVALMLSPLLRWAAPSLRHAILAGALVCCGLVPFIILPNAPHGGVATEVRVVPQLPVRSRSAAPAIASVYALLIMVAAVRLAVAHRRARSLVRHATEAISDDAAEAARTLGIHELRAAQIPAPITIGATVIVPASAHRESLFAMMAHEAAHVHRRDWWIHYATEVATLAVALNPAVWMLKRATATAREIACDAFVTRLHVAADRYAETLLAAARAQSDSYAMAFGGARALATRLRFLRRRTPAAGISISIAAIAGAAIVLTSAAACKARVNAFTDISGHYTLNRNASTFGPIRPYDSFDSWMMQDGLKISSRQVRVRGGRAEHFQWTIVADGKERPFLLKAGRRGVARAAWRGETLVIEVRENSGHQEHTEVTLDRDRRSLICAVEIREKSFSGRLRYVFERVGSEKRS